MDSTLGNYKIGKDMVSVNLYGTIKMCMKENGRTISDMVLVFLSHKEVKFMKENGLMINKKLRK